MRYSSDFIYEQMNNLKYFESVNAYMSDNGYTELPKYRKSDKYIIGSIKGHEVNIDTLNIVVDVYHIEDIYIKLCDNENINIYISNKGKIYYYNGPDYYDYIMSNTNVLDILNNKNIQVLSIDDIGGQLLDYVSCLLDIVGKLPIIDTTGYIDIFSLNDKALNRFSLFLKNLIHNDLIVKVGNSSVTSYSENDDAELYNSIYLQNYSAFIPYIDTAFIGNKQIKQILNYGKVSLLDIEFGFDDYYNGFEFVGINFSIDTLDYAGGIQLSYDINKDYVSIYLDITEITDNHLSNNDIRIFDECLEMPKIILEYIKCYNPNTHYTENDFIHKSDDKEYHLTLMFVEYVGRYLLLVLNDYNYMLFDNIGRVVFQSSNNKGIYAGHLVDGFIADI